MDGAGELDVEGSDVAANKHDDDVSDDGPHNENIDTSPTKEDIRQRIAARGGVGVSMLSLCWMLMK